MANNTGLSPIQAGEKRVNVDDKRMLNARSDGQSVITPKIRMGMGKVFICLQ
ncbi:ribonucleotide-diphosphate reductase subunit beta [Candidatus Liberibacter asiaticus str. gxpsy]|uniref:Ribonucleotide-diphosphate reductase subunit beta n=1 Tax=Candidatus Liberibacter asiaticus str. gxpsy TaxID=1174529 RepID=A0ABM5NE07_LIBAS|nr:ribonucleotide-diphosphate reductase subunit beta [Candidatus Liberibacter asiaticus str. gxpsy]